MLLLSEADPEINSELHKISMSIVELLRAKGDSGYEEVLSLAPDA